MSPRVHIAASEQRIAALRRLLAIERRSVDRCFSELSEVKAQLHQERIERQRLADVVERVTRRLRDTHGDLLSNLLDARPRSSAIAQGIISDAAFLSSLANSLESGRPASKEEIAGLRRLSAHFNKPEAKL